MGSVPADFVPNFKNLSQRPIEKSEIWFASLSESYLGLKKMFYADVLGANRLSWNKRSYKEQKDKVNTWKKVNIWS